MSRHARIAQSVTPAATAHTDAVRLLLGLVTGRLDAAPEGGIQPDDMSARDRVKARPAERTPREIRALIDDEIIPAAAAPSPPPRRVTAEAREARRATPCGAPAAAQGACGPVDAEWEPA